MKKYFYLALFSIIAVIITSCNDNSTEPKVTNQDVIRPLKIGNTWEYEVEDFQGKYTMTLKIVRDSLLIGEKIYKMGNIVGNNIVEAPNFYLNRTDGQYEFYPESWGDTAHLLIKYPANVGDVFSDGWNEIKVESTNFECKVKAGTFKCYKYYYETDVEGKIEEKGYIYYSPGIGHVLTEVYKPINDNTDWGLEFRRELISYKIK